MVRSIGAEATYTICHFETTDITEAERLAIKFALKYIEHISKVDAREN